MDGDTPTLVVTVLAAVFFALAVQVYFVRSGDEEIEKLSLFSIAFAMTVSGASLASECILLAVLFSSSTYAGLGAAVLLGRLLHVPAGIKIALSLYGVWDGGAALAKKMSSQLVLKSMWYSVVSLFGLVEVPLLRFLPWLRSDFTLHSQGYPDIKTTRLCTYVKLVNSIITFACSAYFLHLINSDQHVQASYVLYFNISLAIQCAMLMKSAQETFMRSSFLAQMQLGESSRRSTFNFGASKSGDENQTAPSSFRNSDIQDTSDASSRDSSSPALRTNFMAPRPSRRLSLSQDVTQENAPVSTKNPLRIIQEDGSEL